MIQKMSSERLGEALARVCHWETRSKSEQGDLAARSVHPAFTITLSREAGAGGSLVAQAVGARLGWPVYDHELLQRIAQEMGLRTTLLQSVDEKGRSWMRSFLESFASGPAVSDTGYFHHLVETVLSLGAHGECVLVGRGASHLLPAESTLRVRLVGPRAERIAATSRKLGISQEEAARQVETTDRERTQFVKDHFQQDPADPRNYDLVLNSSRFAPPACADLIVEALHRLQARAAGK
jgi:cytidylate kinase